MRKRTPLAAAALAAAVIVYVVLQSLPDPLVGPRFDYRPEVERCDLEGRVLDREGAPLAGVPIRMRILEPGPAWEIRAGPTAADGTFSAEVFPPRGLWSVVAAPADRPSFDAPVEMVPGGRVTVEVREPATFSEAAPEPNITGDVGDSYGRAISGVGVFARTGDGRVLARTVTGSAGEFALYADAAPPVTVCVTEGGDEVELLTVPHHDLHLFVENLGQPRGELTVGCEFLESVPNDQARLLVMDNLGRFVLNQRVGFRNGPHRFRRVTYGPVDIRISTPEFAGYLQGFDFGPDHDFAVVTVGRAARVRGNLDRKARILLVGRSPTLAPVDQPTRESDGVKGRVRGVWASERYADTFDFRGLAGGTYLIRVLGKGIETREVSIELEPGADLDLGTIELDPAEARVVFRIRDRPPVEDEITTGVRERTGLEFGYIIRLYNTDGLAFDQHVPPGFVTDVVFDGLPAGRWYYRSERKLAERGHRRYIGSDQPLEVAPGEEETVAIDATWRY